MYPLSLLRPLPTTAANPRPCLLLHHDGRGQGQMVSTLPHLPLLQRRSVISISSRLRPSVGGAESWWADMAHILFFIKTVAMLPEIGEARRCTHTSLHTYCATLRSLEYCTTALTAQGSIDACYTCSVRGCSSPCAIVAHRRRSTPTRFHLLARRALLMHDCSCYSRAPVFHIFQRFGTASPCLFTTRGGRDGVRSSSQRRHRRVSSC